MIRRVRYRSLSRRHTEDDPLPRRDNLHATARAADMTIKPRLFGDLISYQNDGEYIRADFRKAGRS